VSNGSPSDSSPFTQFCNRHFVRAAVVVLALAAFNLGFRLNREIITEWDESLYAIAAAETAAHGNWIGTTYLRELDYYNSKPPLNVWLIASSFRMFGPDLISLRLPSVIAAWLTILVLVIWVRRAFDPATALLAGVVLSTTFGFLYVHSGRSANTDALFTLFMLLSVVTLWASYERPWRLVWLGPLLAGVFLLRGPAVFMPLVLVGLILVLDFRQLWARWLPLSAAAMLFAVPVGAWVVARYQLDQWRFLKRMFHYDFVALSTRPLEGHTGTPLYYLNVLQKDQYDWLLAAFGALVLVPIPLAAVRRALTRSPRDRQLAIICGSWIGVTLVIPTLMQTKLAWYLTPFFPAFALLVALTFTHGFGLWGDGLGSRRWIVAGLVMLAFTVAETKLIWYSYNMRGLQLSAQGLMLEERKRLKGRRVYRERWPGAGRFVLEHVVGGEPRQVDDELDFVKKGQPGDFILLSRSQAAYSRLQCPRTNQRYALCEYPP
jgi:4-amino-4-deoxy-L-arabinose transferase-like glycosyltransferase